MMTMITAIFAVLLSLLPRLSLGQTPPPGVVGGGAVEFPQVVLDEITRCGSPFDAHLHLEAQWFTPTNAQPLLAEMTSAGIAQGIIMAVYGPTDPIGVDPNEGVASFVQQSDGRLFALASLNTTGDDWETAKDKELERLTTFLEMDGFVAAKLAPPHTRLPMNSTIMRDILHAVSRTSKPIVSLHVGTTPFCGPFGDFVLGQRGLCGPEYVDPYYLKDYIAEFSNVTFVMMHGGQDFDDGSSGDVPFYNGTNFDHTIELMGEYKDNMLLEISAMLARTDGTYRNPLAFENLLKVVDANLQNRTLYGSDANQFPGGIASYLNSTVESLIAAGFTEEERCHILVDFPKEVYNIPNAALTSTPNTTMPSSPTAAPSTPNTTMPSSPTAAPSSGGGSSRAPFNLSCLFLWITVVVVVLLQC